MAVEGVQEWKNTFKMCRLGIVSLSWDVLERIQLLTEIKINYPIIMDSVALML